MCLLAFVHRDTSDRNQPMWVGSLFPNGNTPQKLFLNLEIIHLPLSRPDWTSPFATILEPVKMCALGSPIFMACCRARDAATMSASLPKPGEPSWSRDMLPEGWNSAAFQWAAPHTMGTAIQEEHPLSFHAVGPKGIPKLLEGPSVEVPVAAPQCQWARGWAWGLPHFPARERPLTSV